MKTARFASIAAVLPFAFRVAAHGPGEGALHPHVHPHDGGVEGWVLALVVVVGGVLVGVVRRATRK